MFGGGITVVNGFLLLSTSAWKYLFSHHFSFHFSSLDFGSYVFASSLLILFSFLCFPSFYWTKWASPLQLSAPHKWGAWHFARAKISDKPDFDQPPILKTVHRTVLSHAWQQKTPFTSVKGEFSAVPPYFIYAVTHISLTFYNGNYSGITYFNRSIIRFRSYLPSSFFRNCLSAGSSSSFAQSPAKLP